MSLQLVRLCASISRHMSTYLFPGVPRGVTATFTAALRRLTHPGTSVGLRGSPLIHSIPSSGDLCAIRPPVLRHRSSPLRGLDGLRQVVTQSVVPCFTLHLRRGGFVHTVLPVGHYPARRFAQEPNGWLEKSPSDRPEWNPDFPRISRSETNLSPSITMSIVNVGHLSSGCASHPESL